MTAKNVSSKGKKTESSRNNILYVILTLKNHSDRNKPLTASEITDHLNSDFKSECGGGVNRTTVIRLLENLYNDPIGLFRSDDLEENSYPEDIEDLHNAGFYLRCMYKENGVYKDIEKLPESSGSESRSDDKKKKVAKYYYYESTLLESELITLYDAIETYNYFSKEDVQSISLKLASIRPLLEKRIKYIPSPADEALRDYTAVLDNVSRLAEIISNNNLAKIGYTYFDSKLKIRNKKGYPKIMRPLKLLWSNGYYYCIMGIEKYENTVHLRIDRISDVEEIKATEKDLAKYSGIKGIEAEYVRGPKNDYRAKHPVMFSGKLENYTLLVNAGTNNMMNTMVDIFGRQIKTAAADASTLKQMNIKPGADDEWVITRVKSTDDGMVLFATEYCKDVCIYTDKTSPAKVTQTAKRVRDALMAGLSRYK